MSEKIMTLHPQGKQGVNIDLGKYTTMKEAILAAISEHGTITFKGLNEAVGAALDGNFDGSIGWYLTTVKLDLEARGVIERLPKASPQQIRRAQR